MFIVTEYAALIYNGMYQALVMIEYQVINHLIFQPEHMLWILKRTVRMRRFFQALNYNLNLMIMSLKKKHIYTL